MSNLRIAEFIVRNYAVAVVNDLGETRRMEFGGKGPRNHGMR